MELSETPIFVTISISTSGTKHDYWDLNFSYHWPLHVPSDALKPARQGPTAFIDACIGAWSDSYQHALGSWKLLVEQLGAYPSTAEWYPRLRLSSLFNSGKDTISEQQRKSTEPECHPMTGSLGMIKTVYERFPPPEGTIEKNEKQSVEMFLRKTGLLCSNLTITNVVDVNLNAPRKKLVHDMLQSRGYRACHVPLPHGPRHTERPPFTWEGESFTKNVKSESDKAREVKIKLLKLKLKMREEMSPNN